MTRSERVADSLLVLRAQVGDDDAYARLFERYDERLRYYVRRLLGSDAEVAEAEDVTQEVWLTVVRKLTTLEQPDVFRAWLYRIAHNETISRFRKDRRLVELSEEDQARVPAPAADRADAAYEGFAAEDAAALHAALDRLSAAHAEVLTLRFLEDLSYEEIARVTGCNIGTARSRLHYAKQALRYELTPTAEGAGTDQETDEEEPDE